MNAVLTSKSHKDHIKALSQNPIIVEMYNELPKTLIIAEVALTYHFMVQAMKEFARRGGTGSETIGSVAEALALLEKTQPK